MDHNDIRFARERAETAIKLADRAVREAVELIKNRLRTSSNDSWLYGTSLGELKSELKDFNAKTRQWKKKS